MNIPADILALAGAFEVLEPTATGGGCDYIIRKLTDSRDDGPCLVLSAAQDAGSPDTASEPCNVVLYTNGNWDAGVSFTFTDAETALRWMAQFNAVTLF